MSTPRKKAAVKKASKKTPRKTAPPKQTPPKQTADDEAAFQKVRSLCLALPDTKLTMTWGSPHFRVGEKIFCGFGAEDGKQVMGVKLGMNHARGIVKDARFWRRTWANTAGSRWTCRSVRAGTKSSS